jgi:hypothetical protein
VGDSSLGGGETLAAFPGTLVAQSTTSATSGTYFISVSALLQIGSGDTLGAFCYDTLASNGGAFQYGGSSSAGVQQGFQQASISDVISISAGDSVELFCYGSNGGFSSVFNAGITATLINSASDASKKPRHPRNIIPPGTSEAAR